MYSNIISSGQSIVHRPLYSKSNIELINSLRANFATFHHPPNLSTDSDKSHNLDYRRWTTQEGEVLYVPSRHPTPLSEPRDSYDITAKLFYLPGIPTSRRCRHTQEAIALVLNELGVDRIDLLIVSFPGVSLDADDDGEEEEASVDEENASAHSNDDESQSLDSQVKTWRALESLQEKGTIAQLGVAEFSSERLEKLLPEVKVKPTVDQISVKDCCVVPKTLIMYAKEHQIELLTHSDCTDILPPGTTRELLGPGKDGAGIIAARPDAGDDEPGLKGDVEPQWVIKYTAVVKNRGVIENKGYFAVAQLGSCIEEKPTLDGGHE